MINILKEIFIAIKFKLIKEFEFKENSAVLFQNIERAEFFIITDFDNLNDFEEDYYTELTTHLKKEITNKTFDKNVSLIICSKIENEEEYNKIEKTIFQIEEDPYNFKKYVLTYQQIEVTEFYKKIENNKLTFSKLEDNLNNIEYFNQYKINLDTPSFYSLLVKIFIKVPILKLKINEKETKNLEQEIKNKLEQEQLLTLNNNLFDIEKTESSENIIEKLNDFISK